MEPHEVLHSILQSNCIGSMCWNPQVPVNDPEYFLELTGFFQEGTSNPILGKHASCSQKIPAISCNFGVSFTHQHCDFRCRTSLARRFASGQCLQLSQGEAPQYVGCMTNSVIELLSFTG